MNFDEVTRDIYVTPIIKIVTKNRKGQNILLNGRRISQVYVYVETSTEICLLLGKK